MIRPSLAVATLFVLLTPPPPADAARRTLRDEIADSKYQRGDYAFYVSWHDPWDAQFDEHGNFAWPIGGKVRFRLTRLLRAEVDFSYYQRGGTAQAGFVTFASPGFDGVMLAGTLQSMLVSGGAVRPYVGGGPIFVSLGNDFVAEVAGVDANIVDRFVFATWTELDVGLQAVAGLDIPLGRKAFPFIEYRHLFGRFTISNIKVGALTVGAEEILRLDGSAVSQEYDWSGPGVLVGLKVRF